MANLELPTTNVSKVYREYDCYEPNARAPTPLPPMALEDLDVPCMNEATTINNIEEDSALILRQREEAYSISRSNLCL